MNIKPYKISSIKLLLKVCGFVVLVILTSPSPLAQTDSTSSDGSEKTRINILGASVIERNPEISDASRLIGNVKLALDDAILTCDSAYRFDDGRFEVFSEIVISQEPTTILRANYGVLNPDIGAVEIKGDVTFHHEELSISCPSLSYNIDTKHVSYYERAIITEGDRFLSSNIGVYSSKTNRLYAGGNVEILELKDIIQSDSLSIDRNSKTLRLYKSSYLEIGEAIIKCEKGEYNGKTGKGWFSGPASMMDDQGLLAGDSIIINRDDNMGMAWGHVMISDSSKSMNVKGVFASRSKNSDLVTGLSHDLVQIVNVEGSDTLKMHTLSLEQRENMFYASGGVVFKQGEFSGSGDSLSWNKSDDEMWLLGEPVVWSQEDEMTGDTVKMQLKENRPSSMQMIGNANVLSPVNDSLDHFISGRNLLALFSKGKLSSVDVIGNGIAQYYSIDDLDDISVNRATCSQIQMLFSEGKVTKITLLGLPDGKFNPLDNRENENIQTRRIKPQL